jgi:hypothetical protein
MTKTPTAAELAAAALAEGAPPPEITAPNENPEPPPAETPPAEVDLKRVRPGQRVRKGAPPVAGDSTSANVLVRVTKAGHGEVHDGEGGTYDWGDEVLLPRSVGTDLEGRQFGEIVGTA